MKLTIVAATGGIGRQLFDQAISAGHDITVVARNPQNLSLAPARAVAADFASADPATLQPAVAGADAVLSALGPRTKADAGVAARGTKVITRAMQAAGVRRIIVVSAAPIGTVPRRGAPRPGTTRARVHHPVPSDPIVKRAPTATPTWPVGDVLRASD
jgi:putative NADH-flavin reductase